MERKILDGWKEIAEYVGKSVRTVQRWEKEENFPIKRIKDRKSVFAYPEEIDKWLAKKEKKHNTQKDEEENPADKRLQNNTKPKISPYLLIIGTFILLFIAGYSFTYFYKTKKLQNRKLYYEVQGEGSILNIKDQYGNILKTFHTESDAYKKFAFITGNCQYIHFVDLNNDKILDIVYAEIAPEKAKVVKIFLSDSKGNLVEKKRFNLSLSYKDKKTNYIYDNLLIQNLKVADIDNDGKLELVVLQIDVPLYPSCVRVMDLNGKEKFRFWHPGRLRSLEIREVKGEKAIIVSGTNNCLHKLSLPVIVFIKSDWKFYNKTLDFIQPENTNFNPLKFLNMVYLTFFIDNFKITNYYIAQFYKNNNTETHMEFAAFYSPKVPNLKYKKMGINFSVPQDILHIITDYQGHILDKFFVTSFLVAENIKNPEDYIDKHVKILYYDGEKWQKDYTPIVKPFKPFKKLPYFENKDNCLSPNARYSHKSN